MKELKELLKRIEALEDRIRLLEYQLAPEESEPEQESGWYPCATTGCGAQVRVSGSLCEACRACEELGFSVQPPEESDHRIASTMYERESM